MSVDRRVVMLGAGGHARVLREALDEQGLEIMGVLDPGLVAAEWSHWDELPVLGDDSWLEQAEATSLQLVNAVGGLPGASTREALFERYQPRGFRFVRVCHPSVLLSRSARLGEGVQLMAGVIVQSGVSIGDNTIVNTRASVDHDTCVGRHVHVAPGAVICGGATIGNGAFIGPGAVIGQGVDVGERSAVGAGTAVVRDVPSGCRLLGPRPRLETPGEEE